MNKYALPTIIILAIFAMASFATNYTWVRQGTQNHKIGFGSVISADSSGSMCISSCDGRAYVDGDRSMQLGTGTLTGDDTLQYRDNVILEGDNRLGIEIYGSMSLYYQLWQEEFNEAGYVAGAATTNSLGAAIPGSKFSETAYRGGWLVTVVDGGGDDGETIRVGDAVNSILEIVGNNASNDTVQVQLNGEPFQLVNGKETWFNARFAVGNVDEDNFAIGLTLRASTDVIGTAPADGVYFESDHDGNLDYHVIQNSTDTTADTGVDLADDTFVTVGWYHDGASNLTISVNGTAITTLVDNATTVLFPDDEQLTPFVAVESYNTNATADCAVDYIGVIHSR